MNSKFKYIFIALGILIVGFILWYFKSIVTYILISAVLSIVGKPLVDLLDKIHIKKIKIPKAISALATLIVIWTVFVLFFRFFIPLIANQASDLSLIDINTLTSKFQEPINKINQLIIDYNISTENAKTVEDYMSEKIIVFMNGTFLSNFFNSIVGILGNIFIAAFSISFITFFFLKDQNLFYNGILIFVPEKLTDNFVHVLNSIKKLLTRYFIGIIIEVLGVITLVSIGLTIVGINFQSALVIGLIAGIFNIIPYIGPLIGSSIGIIIGFATHINLDFYTELFPLLLYMAIVFSLVQVVDNVVFQPFIYSSSVNAHPLEIFLVIMIAASLAGIIGMILAVPTYTIIRVFAKEFFNNFKVVKKLTEKI
ncbi:MAG: AI-2E family transporter [Bacteroidetes bacterium GWC2_33_15]|nr:MAG: AI-2E family transporter [Bacteroidetes bacterium GWA2_33_15]OFX51347.1 MAG: AI-2E family transporter [Bacteroidetes bacterium GWC2_33_15]OFX65126.1 MAG: AI-2E family transporter [Bacteroidetes bacterium GWB2_32_14]OFX70723.1 MAG: AI-2E family transporter [Bacteroidetes bacterium GWD2_33_33]HAN18479.1 AI-2E family transporter [Bacteroidales bacterium]